MKVVLITGCSSGFGHLLVDAFLAKDYLVLATMRRAVERGSLFQSQKNKYGDKLQIINFDVTSKTDLEAVVNEIKKIGRLDCLINNAGLGVFSALEDASEDQIRMQFDINVMGLILTTRALLPFLRKSKGHLINFSSVYGFSVAPITSLYCSSKYAVEGFSESLYYELLPHGVRVSIVEPGGFATDFKTNIVFGKDSFSETSPYHLQSQNYKKYGEAAMKHLGQPHVVIDAVMKAVEHKNPPLRIRRGKDAFVVHLAKGLAPEVLFRSLSRLFFGMTINKK